MPGKNGKITKVLFSAYGVATGTDEKYKDTWATYEEACAAMLRCGASGIGFKVPEGVYFLDVDHKDMADPLLQKLLKRHNSYAELSPSGNGIHILGTCDVKKLPIIYDEKKQRNILSSEFYQKNSAIGIELYIGSVTNRFATFTGNVINDVPLSEGTEAVLRHWMRICGGRIRGKRIRQAMTMQCCLMWWPDCAGRRMPGNL